MKKIEIIVVGCANMDILGVPEGTFTLRDSNIGHVLFRPGGVGRNIAERCAALPAKTALIAAFGNDKNAEALIADCELKGIDASLSPRFDEPSSIYLCVHDGAGDMIAAVNDMRLSKRLTREALAPLIPSINAAGVCVLDANLPEDTLLFLADAVTVPLIADPVSLVKAPRLVPILSKLAAFKPNLSEALALSGADSPEQAAQWLLQRGVKRAFISMGREGVYFADAGDCGALRPAKIETAPQTGAGDAFTAGAARAVLNGAPVRACAQAGMDAAADFLRAKYGSEA